ncbi:MAG: hypothetical protein A2046_04750 [Bacteroidetes bacterium GWA2_30_7]|nr:MAG: hypothetical protein A2046_04750 [Bacteroidetes bacterium GWA2_30_7]
MNGYDFIYYCDSFTEIGLGHLSRGIDFTNEFSSRFPFYKIAIRGIYSESAMNFISANLSGKVTVLDKDDESISAISFVDTMFYPGSLDINYDFFRKLKTHTKKLILFFDVLDVTIPPEVDIYINYLPYTIIRGKTENQKVFVGFKYLPVPDAFFNSNYFGINGDIVCIFGADKDGYVIFNFLNIIIQEKFCKRNIKVLLSPHYSKEFKEELSSKYQKIAFLQNINNVHDLLNNAALVISTYGNSTFQSIAAKKPNFSIAFQDFQNNYATRLEEEGFTVNLGTFSNIDENKLALINNSNYLLTQNEKLKVAFKTPGINNLINVINNELQTI